MTDFWDSKAQNHGFEVKAVNNDPLEEELEMHFLERLVPNRDATFCDLGCGNGRTLLELGEKKPEMTFHGVDVSEEMIETAKSAKAELDIDNVYFYHADATGDAVRSTLDTPRFDFVMSKRLLINTHEEEKHDVIENVDALLKPDGEYIMVECFVEPLHNVNTIRESLGLDWIEVHDFNEYLTRKFFHEISDSFTMEETIEFESFYYFISRVFNAYLADGEPEYHAPINELAVELTKMGVNETVGYGPEIIHLLRKSE